MPMRHLNFPPVLPLLPVLLALSPKAWACTNYLVTPGASKDGSSLVSYAADSGALYGTLGFYAAADHPPGTLRPVWDWDSGTYLGEIAEAPHTYRVVGNTNEFQLTIAETTFGGHSFGTQESAVMDYGTHIWVALQRSRNASEAITVLSANFEKYGWASEGESFSIADPNEVWLMEILGKGANETGAVWVARKIPDGAVTGHANQARIRTFPQNDPSTVRFSPDVIDFARKKGMYNGSDAEFSFSDTFDPVSYTGARLAEIRVWNFFHQVADDTRTFEKEYLDYVSGRNVSHRMPLWVYPYRKISLNDTIWYMRSHFEGTAFDMTKDVGAEEWAASIRTRPLFWEAPASAVISEELPAAVSQPKTYHNERPIGVQQTGWNFVAQMRKWLPDPVGGIVWFSVDDTAHSVRVPFYVGITQVPGGYADEGIQHVDDTRSGEKVDPSKAFWIFNMVANAVYNRWADAHPYVQNRIVEEESKFFKAVAAMDKKAADMIKKSGQSEKVRKMLTKFSTDAADGLLSRWFELWKDLFFRFRDRFTVTRAPPQEQSRSGKNVNRPKYPNYPWPTTNQQGMKAAWRARVIDDTGDEFLVPTAGVLSSHEARKRKILGL